MVKLQKSSIIRSPKALMALRDLKRASDPKQALRSAKYFKSGPGEYGEGDVFLGISVPANQALARAYRDLPLGEIETLLDSKFHEARVLALMVLSDQAGRAEFKDKQRLARFYLRKRKRINNWDLVDGSASYVLGPVLLGKKTALLDRLVKSSSVWDRRIAVLTTFHFIRQNEFATTLKLAARLLEDEHDLMHKAVGWMLREIGKRDRKTLESFLRKHYMRMPRTILRYSIEHGPESRRQAYLKGVI